MKKHSINCESMISCDCGGMHEGNCPPQPECNCDGYHTFDELYEHRITLYILLCRLLVEDSNFVVWRSKTHSDGSQFDGWFVLGIGKEKGYQITYHLPLTKWEETDFAETLDQAPEYDGHTPDDVLERLKKL